MRKLGIGPFVSLERIVAHVPGQHLGYVVASKQPYRDYRADVELVSSTDGGTHIVWQASFEPIVPGTGRLLRMGLRAIVTGFAKNLARAAETTAG